MITEEIRNSFKLINLGLQAAKDELSRPVEDVVTLHVCQVSYDAMILMMRLYLNEHKNEVSDGVDMGELYRLCIMVNPLFTSVDMTNVECKEAGEHHCNGRYCLSIENVNCCLTAADQIKTIIWNEFGIV